MSCKTHLQQVSYKTKFHGTYSESTVTWNTTTPVRPHTLPLKSHSLQKFWNSIHKFIGRTNLITHKRTRDVRVNTELNYMHFLPLHCCTIIQFEHCSVSIFLNENNLESPVWASKMHKNRSAYSAPPDPQLYWNYIEKVAVVKVGRNAAELNSATSHFGLGEFRHWWDTLWMFRCYQIQRQTILNH